MGLSPLTLERHGMNPTTPLLAAVDVADLIRFAVILLIIIVPIIGQLLAKIRQVQQPPAGGPRLQRPPRPVPAEVANEIDDFINLYIFVVRPVVHEDGIVSTCIINRTLNLGIVPRSTSTNIQPITT